MSMSEVEYESRRLEAKKDLENEQLYYEQQMRDEWEQMPMLEKLKRRFDLFLLTEKVYIKKALIVRALGTRMPWRENSSTLEFSFKKKAFLFRLVVANQPIVEISYNDDIPF